MKVVAGSPLTAAKIEALKPKMARYEVSDASSGLRLRVTPNAVKSFRWAVHMLAGQRVITLGHWSATPKPGHLTLSEARSWLERLKEAHKTLGKLEEVEAELRKHTKPPAPTPEEGALTVTKVAEDFMRFIARERKRPEQVKRPIDFDVLPSIGARSIQSITTPDCRRIVEAVVARGSPVQAGIVYATLRQLFSFAWKRGDIEINPMDRLSDPRVLGVEKNMSQRYLTDEELPLFWKALDTYRRMSPTIRNGLKILLLTGVRSGELLNARLDAVNFEKKLWTIPVEHQKLTRDAARTARPWVVPLAPMALRLFEELAGLAKGQGSPYAMASFHAEGEPLTDKALNHAMRQMFEPKKSKKPSARTEALLKFKGERPTPHDLRRTVRTGLGNLGIQWHVAERCLNHSLGKIAMTYDVGDYVEERRAALTRWDEHVSKLIA